jgi:hypothetical protein
MGQGVVVVICVIGRNEFLKGSFWVCRSRFSSVSSLLCRDIFEILCVGGLQFEARGCDAGEAALIFPPFGDVLGDGGQ